MVRYWWTIHNCYIFSTFSHQCAPFLVHIRALDSNPLTYSHSGISCWPRRSVGNEAVILTSSSQLIAWCVQNSCGAYFRHGAIIMGDAGLRCNSQATVIEISYCNNLAIANSSRVSCAHNTSRASIVTSWPLNLGKGLLKVIENGAVRYIIYTTF